MLFRSSLCSCQCADGYESWLGDGFCDGTDMAYGLDFSCYGCDAGDCNDECGVCEGSGIADGATGSWIEQGPRMTRSRSSSSFKREWISERCFETVSAEWSVIGNSAQIVSGFATSRILAIRRFSVWGLGFIALVWHRPGSFWRAVFY